MLRRLLICAFILVAEMAFGGDKKTEPEVPNIPDALQRNYMREMAIFSQIDAAREAAKTSQEKQLEERMSAQDAKVKEAMEAMRTACGEKFTLDVDALRAARLVCMKKPDSKPEKK